MKFHDALSCVWDIIREANQFIDQKAPWSLKKQNNIEELRDVMLTLVEVLRRVIQAVWPFMPQSAEKCWAQLGLQPESLVTDDFKDIAWSYFEKDTPIHQGDPVFPRRDTGHEGSSPRSKIS
jgi:methionyl-tRNA synthetase